MSARAGAADHPMPIEERLHAVAMGSGFAVLPVGIAEFYRRDDVAYIPLEGVAPVQVALAYLPNRTMPELETFVAMTRRHLGSPVDVSAGTGSAHVR